ncbi:hypothetical protein WUBG_01094 [Wuchereria bancrofti]|uniref:Uncharacterized protein n=1 Tax=Wuchereria bancrofti TaxID=6293 RepID=J9BKK0_WUCBA|nr:hypothetical protein WUBG_01094 [Wuchereria bancrofti]
MEQRRRISTGRRMKTIKYVFPTLLALRTKRKKSKTIKKAKENDEVKVRNSIWLYGHSNERNFMLIDHFVLLTQMSFQQKRATLPRPNYYQKKTMNNACDKGFKIAETERTQQIEVFGLDCANTLCVQCTWERFTHFKYVSKYYRTCNYYSGTMNIS